MSYRVEISPEAQKEIKALSGYVRAEALQILRALNPTRARPAQKNCATNLISIAFGWRKIGESCIRLTKTQSVLGFCACAERMRLITKASKQAPICSI